MARIGSTASGRFGRAALDVLGMLLATVGAATLALLLAMLFLGPDAAGYAETPAGRFEALAERLCGPRNATDGGMAIPVPAAAHFDCLTERLLRSETR